MKQVENSRISISRNGPASNEAISGVAIPGGAPAPAAQVVLPQSQPQTQYVYVTEHGAPSIHHERPLIHRHTRQHTAYDSRSNYHPQQVPHIQPNYSYDKNMYDHLYGDLYERLYMDVNHLVENRLSRSYVRTRSRRSVEKRNEKEQNGNPLEDNGNVSKNDTETPLHSYISIEGPLGRYDVIHIPSTHMNATNTFSLSFQNGTLHVSGYNVTIDHDEEFFENVSGSTSIFVGQEEYDPSRDVNSIEYKPVAKEIKNLTHSYFDVTSYTDNSVQQISLNSVGITNLVIGIILLVAIFIGCVVFIKRRFCQETGEAIGHAHLLEATAPALKIV